MRGANAPNLFAPICATRTKHVNSEFFLYAQAAEATLAAAEKTLFAAKNKRERT